MASLERAWRGDPAFRGRLAADPAAALASRGMRLPAGIREVRVAEDTADTVRVIFPGAPDASLSDEALTGAAGGAGGIVHSGFCRSCGRVDTIGFLRAPARGDGGIG